MPTTTPTNPTIWPESTWTCNEHDEVETFCQNLNDIPHHGGEHEEASEFPNLSLPEEPGTISFRSDGSVTVAGHRIRLRRVVELMEKERGSLQELSEALPTLERSLLAKLLRYVAANKEAVEEYVKNQDEIASRYRNRGTQLRLDQLRKLAAN
jgi:uncharacterized protein (DUF433 family)